MKVFFRVLCVLCSCAVLVFSAHAAMSSEPVRVKLLLPGSVEDKAFNFMALQGLMKAKELYGDRITTDYTELLFSQSGDEYLNNAYLKALMAASDEPWDVIVTLAYPMKKPLEQVAPQHPDKTYILIDSEVDYQRVAGLENVYSAVFRQSESSFLAGALAAHMTTRTEIPGINEEKAIAFLGAYDVPVINDFLVGYIQGSRYINKQVRVDVKYVDSFTDRQKAAALASSQFDPGVAADVGFNVAGMAGLGQVDAAAQAGVYFIGVDTDQYRLFEDEPQKARRIVSSAIKKVDHVVLNALQLFMEGKLPVGQRVSLGLKEKSIGLVKNENYTALLPQDIQESLLQIEKAIIDGTIEVSTLLK